MLTDWSVFELPKKSNFADLYEAINTLYMPATPYVTQNTTISGTYRTRKLGNATVMEVTADGHGVKRDRSEVNRSEGEYCSFKFMMSGYGEIEQEGNITPFRAGDIITFDNNYPYRISCYDRFSFTFFVVPRLQILPHLISPKLVQAGLITANSSLSPILHAYMNELLQLKLDKEDYYSSKLTETLCGLVSIALDPSNKRLGNNARSINKMRLMKLTDYVQSHLSDPELSPKTVAGACGISVRYLHKLFEPHGVTFGSWVLKQRLERCREQIADPRFQENKLSLISYNWGFNNPSHFIRAFRGEYGMCPRDYRKQAQAVWMQKMKTG
jgi:AraC-like DNA-binding protein